MSAEIIQFLPKAARERDALVREARKVYEGIFPPEKLDQAAIDATAPCEMNPGDPA